MNYELLYNKIITRAKLRKTTNEYTEVHHILPKCMGGDDSVQNLVELTGREHYIVHQLLTKIYPANSGLILAAMRMCSSSEEHCDGRSKNRLYSWKREKWAKHQATAMIGDGNPMFGKVWIFSLEEKKSKVINKTDILPNGWQYGRVKNFDRPYDPIKKKFINDWDYVAMTDEERQAKKNQFLETQKIYAEELYQLYVDGKFKSVSAFYKTLDIKESRQALIQIWDRHIPEYKFRKKER